MKSKTKASDHFRRWFDIQSLETIFVSEVLVKPTVGIDKVTASNFAQNLNDNLSILSRKAFDGSYSFTSYSQMLVLKGPESKPRELCIPTIRDKVALKALSHVLDDTFGDICRTMQPQVIVDEIVESIKSEAFDSFVKFDIERFYASIDHDHLLKGLRGRMRKKELLSMIEGAISTPSVSFGSKASKRRARGVPEGLPVSGKLANIYLSKLDATFRKDASIVYFRYVDDILVLCKSHSVESLKRKMEVALRKIGLSLNVAKTKNGILGSDKFEYLGYLFSGTDLAVGQKARKKIESSIDAHLRAYNEPILHQWLWRLNLRITGCRITEDGESYQRFGWLYYYSRAGEIAYLAKLDHLVKRIARRRGVDLPKEVKSFKKAYYEIKFKEGKTNYIPTFDLRMDVNEKREILEKDFGLANLDQKSDDEINTIFNQRLRKEVSLLERDAGVIS